MAIGVTIHIELLGRHVIKNLLENDLCKVSHVDNSQTGKYVVRAEGLQGANNLSRAQRPIKRAKLEKYTCQAFRHLQKGTITYAEALRGWFF